MRGSRGAATGGVRAIWAAKPAAAIGAFSGFWSR